MKFVTEEVNLSNEPTDNWKSVQYYMPAVAVDGSESSEFSLEGSRRSIGSSVRHFDFVTGNSILKSLIATTERPSDNHSLHDVLVNEFKSEIQCFMYVLCRTTFTMPPV